MIPLLQVVTTELPFVLAGLSELDVLQVFASSRLPVGTPVANGSGFAIQSLRGTDLEPAQPPFSYAIPRPVQIKWMEGREEGPSWEDVHGLVSHELIMEFVKDEGCFEAYYDRYAPQHVTKLGGWPSYIQGAPAIDGTFVLQIASEEKPRWMVGDNGTMYFFQDDAEWSLHWDCY